jgi:sulfur relay (sulfurtransferase) complex TusBCD TusD component (DsrE family)
MSILFVINDAPYGTEKAYNALRLAMALQKEHTSLDLRIFLLADAVLCALPGQKKHLTAITTWNACLRVWSNKERKSKPAAPVRRLGGFESFN